MGIIKQGILGGFSGKVGSVVGTSWKGRAVMKAMPQSVANPKTAAQVAQRTAFSDCVAVAKGLLGGSILLLDNPFSGDISGYNRFVSRNVSAFPITEENDWTDVTISEGALGIIAVGSVKTAPLGADSYDVGISSGSSPLNLDTDKVVAVAVQLTTGEILNAGEVVGTRGGGDVTIPVSRTMVAGDIIGTFLSGIRADGKYVSDSDMKYFTVD